MARRSPQRGIGDFYVDVVLPTLATRLYTVFPEFGWKRDRRGWIATNDEMTHRVLGLRAARGVAHGPAPRGFLIHGGDATLWTAYMNGGAVPTGGRVHLDRPPDRSASRHRHITDRQTATTRSPRRPPARLLHALPHRAPWSAGAQARSYLEHRRLPPDASDRAALGVVPGELVTKKALEAAGYSELEIAQPGVLADGRWPGRLCGAMARGARHDPNALGPIPHRLRLLPRYLYLRGARRSALPPYGLSDLVRLPRRNDASSSWSKGSWTFTTSKPKN